MNEIDRLFADWMAATARGDADVLTELVTEDAEFWSPGTPAMRGRETVSAVFRDAFRKYSVERSWTEIERLVGTDFMVSVGIEKTRVTPRSGGDPIDVTQRGWTMARRCPDGRWRFARGITNRET
jgi:uncharacterized protein (TIGR02246 family)